MVRALSKTKDETARKRSRTVCRPITLDGDLDIERNSDFSLPSFPKGIGNISRRELNALLGKI